MNTENAERYNRARPYTRDLWSRVQEIVGADVDGIPGSETATKIAEYQQSHQLEPDGYCGPLTLSTMGEGPFEITDERVHVPNGKLAIDADGAPNAYNRPDTGIDHLANAGSTGNWWGIATNSEGVPFIQTPDDPCPNHYVSTTSLIHPAHPVYDPRRYVDSTSIPYVALPKNLSDLLPSSFSFRLGDLVVVKRENSTVCSVYADVGPTVVLEPDRLVNNTRETNRRRFGEGSIALSLRLVHSPYTEKNHLWRASVGISLGVRFSLVSMSGTGEPMSLDQLTDLHQHYA